MEGPYPAYPSGKSWNETSGKTGSEKKFYHNVISGAVSEAQSYCVAIITPVIHCCVAVWKSGSKPVLGLYAAGEEVVILFWIAWFSAAWQEELVPGTCWATARRPLLSRHLLVEGIFEESNSGQVIVVGGWLGRYVNSQHRVGKRWQRGVVGQVVVRWWRFDRGNRWNQWSEHENTAREENRRLWRFICSQLTL